MPLNRDLETIFRYKYCMMEQHYFTSQRTKV